MITRLEKELLDKGIVSVVECQCDWCGKDIVGGKEDMWGEDVCPKCFNSIPDRIWAVLDDMKEYITKLETQRDMYRTMATSQADGVDMTIPLEVENSHVIKKPDCI